MSQQWYVHPCSFKAAANFSERQTNIRVDKPVKKAKTDDNSQHGSKDTARELEQATSTSTVSGSTSLTESNTVRGRLHYMNGDLPAELQEGRMWTKQILPAVLTWAGNLSDPWVIRDDDLMRALRAIITVVVPGFRDLNAKRPGSPIFMLV